MKTKIICVVGESGAGKSHMVSYLEDEFGIPQIESRTTRPPRFAGERGHTFVTEEEFDTYQEEHMLAYTEWKGHHYCCLHQDVHGPMVSYVIDEYGLNYLRENFSGMYDIFAVRLFMDEEKRASLVTEERMLRDEGKFNMSDDEFDYFIDTTDFDKNERKYAKMLIRCYQKFDNE